jgi:hypothetical protein
MTDTDLDPENRQELRDNLDPKDSQPLQQYSSFRRSGSFRAAIGRILEPLRPSFSFVNGSRDMTCASNTYAIGDLLLLCASSAV